MTGRRETAKKLTEHAATLAAESQVPHRQAADLYCRGLVERDPHRLMAAAARYEDACRPLYQAKALDYFDMISWLESKIKRKPFSEILRKKSKF